MSIKKIRLMTPLSIMTTMLLVFFAGHLATTFAQEIQPDVYNQLKYRYIGPQGNRTIAVVGVPGDPNICYTGAASGGIWKSTDGGVHWKPIFDDQPVSSIGSLAIAPSDSNIIWAGTGETFIRSNISIGNGIYKSTDAGKTWAHMGLEKTGRIGRIVIDPRESNIIFAAAMGHCYGPQAERGVFRTTDGGKTWQKVLFVDENTGCSDIAMDPNNSRILFAGMWQLVIRTWGRKSGGPGSGLYMSRDGGTTWKRISGHGLPEPPMGKIALAVAQSNSNRVYALIESKEGVLWRSDDGGENWKMVNSDLALTARPPYFSRCVVAPDDANEVYFLADRLRLSLDGGQTYKIIPDIFPDNHDMWIDPKKPNRMMVANDYYVNISTNHGQSWLRVGLPVAQMYHVAVDNRIPYYVYGNRQDGPSHRGPSNSLRGTKIPSGVWQSVGGGESGFAIPDPVDNNIIWSSAMAGYLHRFDLRTGHVRSVEVWPFWPTGWPAGRLRYRFQWSFPVVISPHDHNKVYVGSQYVHKTTDGGYSWKIISPDLSTNDKSKQQSSGGIIPDNIGAEYCCCLFALAESPLEEGLIWAGTNDGLVHVTRDDGKHWTNVTSNIPNLPPWGTMSNIEPSRYDAGTCYITVDFHQVNNRNPYIYKTTDYGKTWKSISSDIPRSVFSYVHCVREDPVRKGLLYLGTENALYVSFNDGKNWLPLQNNLPHAPVHWMAIQEHFNDLVVATYGRGFWILDDITPLQQLTYYVIQSKVHLFAPRPAYRFQSKQVGSFYSADEFDPPPSIGQNPPYGASINYYLKSAPSGNVKITILDEKDQTVKTLEGTKEVGINRVWWDLRYEPSRDVRLRTRPLDAPYVMLGQEGWRLLPRGWKVSPLVAPGIYTVKLTVDGKEFTQKLTVKKDPSSAGSEEDIKAQLKVMLEIRENLNKVVDMINKIEWIRKQVYDTTTLLKEDKNAELIITAGGELDKKLQELEGNFFDLRLTGRGNFIHYPVQLYHSLVNLANLYIVQLSDFSPTTQQVEMLEEYTKQVSAHQNQLNQLLNTYLAAFNNMLKDNDIPHIIVKNLENK